MTEPKVLVHARMLTEATPMTQLARKLRTIDYFTLGFGTMVGVGWLVVMHDWLLRGGPVGCILGFAIGGAVLLPIGYVYGKLVMAIPDAGSEIAYTAKVFPDFVSFATGWMMVLAYFVVCPWEAVAIGKILSYLLPGLNSVELYRIGGKPVFLPHLVIGLVLAAALTILNYRGVQLSARFQNWTTFGLLGLFLVFGSFGVASGSRRNFTPLFSQTSGLISVLLVIQIVPYFMTGFESIPKCAEEASPEFRNRGFFRAIVAAIVVAMLFYIAVIAVVAYVHPWKELTATNFATAAAFEHAIGARWLVKLVLIAALLSLLKVYNGNLIASSRLVFALGRGGLVNPRLGAIHPRNQTPSVAVVLIGFATAAGLILGEAILVPATEVASLASAFGWLMTCVSYLFMRPAIRERIVATIGALVAFALILMKLLPFVPGHFTEYEVVALTLWAFAGLALRFTRAPQPKTAVTSAL
jgi:APA family basic amino acid/polyamine antiporter